MNKAIINEINNIKKYYTLDDFKKLTENILNLFKSCNISVYNHSYINESDLNALVLEDYKPKLINNSASMIVLSLDIEKRILKRRNNSLIKDYDILFNTIIGNKKILDKAINKFRSDYAEEFAEFKVLIEGFMPYMDMMVCNKLIKKTISRSSFLQFLELKQLFILKYDDNCWLALEALCMSRFIAWVEETSRDKKQLRSIKRLFKNKKFEEKLYTKVFYV